MKKEGEHLNNYELFINSLPNLDSIYLILDKSLFSDIDLISIKTILDIFEFHYQNEDFPMFNVNYK